MNLEAQIEKAVEAYSNQTLIRAAIVAIPYVGSSIDTLICGKATKIQTERILKSISSLQQELSKANEAKMDHHYIDSEEFYDDLISYFNNAAKEKSDLKIIYYAKLLKSRLEGRTIQIGTRYIYDALLNLSEEEVKVLNKVYTYVVNKENSAANPDKNQFDFNSKMLKEITMSDFDFDFILIRLEKEGFVKERTGAFLNYGGGDYYITSITRKLMKIIQEENA